MTGDDRGRFLKTWSNDGLAGVIAVEAGAQVLRPGSRHRVRRMTREPARQPQGRASPKEGHVEWRSDRRAPNGSDAQRSAEDSTSGGLGRAIHEIAITIAGRSSTYTRTPSSRAPISTDARI
jgi:hypothetical protein